MHEIAIARGVSISGREDFNVVPTRTKPGRVLRGKLSHTAAVRRIGGHDMGNPHQEMDRVCKWAFITLDATWSGI